MSMSVKSITLAALLLLLTHAHCARVLSLGTATPPTKPPPTRAPKTRGIILKVHTSRTPARGRKKLVKTPSGGGGVNGAQCDIWAQDCPSSYKCIAESLTKMPRCRPLSDNPDQVGDLCSTLGQNDGDSCDKDGMCVDGVCRELCSGSPNGPSCSAIKDLCHSYASGTPLCEERCDPLLLTCSANTYCSTDAGVPYGQFTCRHATVDNLGIGGAGCTITPDCHQGFACIAMNQMPQGYCQVNGLAACCAPLVENVNQCPAGFSFTTHDFYQNPPPGLEYLEVCVFF